MISIRIPRTLGLLLLLTAGSACGDRLVEFPNGSGGDDDGDDDDNDLDGDGIDDDVLAIIATDPVSDATDVALGKRIDVTFSHAIDPATIDLMSFSVRLGAAEIDGTFAWDATTDTATFIPDVPLELAAEYTATVTTAAEDPAGVSLVEDHVWSFETDACGLLPIDLVSAEGFAVLAASTVTSTGATSVTGDLGLTGTDLVGFPPGEVIGTIHIDVPAADEAMLDLTDAYNDAATRSLCAQTVDGNLGGMVLTPGVYVSGTSLAVSSGDLTLDAEGDDDALFIFRMGETLTTTAGRQMILAGGARAENIYWQVGSSATLGSTSVVKGTIMADQSITLETGASLEGRALARIGAVTMDANTIVRP
jgi:hypothetical protein